MSLFCSRSFWECRVCWVFDVALQQPIKIPLLRKRVISSAQPDVHPLNVDKL